MLAYLSGKVIGVQPGQILVKIPSGVGYMVNVSQSVIFMANENLELYILEVIREDHVELFGFRDLEEREWVEKLMKVSGVGPKMAAGIIYAIGVEKVVEAIQTTNSGILTEVKGLGSKTAKKILLELKGSITDLQILETKTESRNSQTVLDFTETLTNLGYKRGEIVSLITRLKKGGDWYEDDLVSMVKLGLKNLGKK
jgi:holliday junction DNA helicase RuvA